ncbi:MAG TPA: DUF1416 domain-containing protein [Micromonosporaceae bacterium]|nr:DUF1416 domain-containing protein [Micromonosporaceae bacterium]
MNAVVTAGCAAPDQAAPLPASVDLEKETVISGVVVAAADGLPVAGGYVRLLDATGEFTAEVVTSPAGQFRFFAAPGTWTLRVLSRSGTGDAAVTVDRGLNELTLTVSP